MFKERVEISKMMGEYQELMARKMQALQDEGGLAKIRDEINPRMRELAEQIDSKISYLAMITAGTIIASRMDAGQEEEF